MMGIDHLPFQTIRSTALGRDASIPRALAVAVLAASAYPNRRRDLESLIASADESPELRALAADRLGCIEHASTPAALLRHLDSPVPLVRRQIVRRLGFLGDERAVEPLIALSKRETGPARNRARFAAALIAHRTQQESPLIDLPPTSSRTRISQDDAASAVAIRPPRTDVEACVAHLATEPSGIDYGEGSALELNLDGDKWMVLLNAEFEDPDAAPRLAHRCAMLGVVAEWHDTRERYFLTGLVLSSPSPSSEGPRLHLRDVDGVLLAVGQAPCAQNAYTFTLGTVTDDIGLAIELEGALRDGRLGIDTLRAAAISTRKRVATTLAVRAGADPKQG
jgi:hypothetical protein